MAVFPVVLDSCVLYPFYLRDVLLSAAEAQLYRPHWSQKILDDATRNLIKDRRMSKEGAERFSQAITESFPQALIEAPTSLIPCMPNDAGDKHVSAVAMVAKAEVIVTLNLKDFKPNDLDPFFIEAQSPDDFLTKLYDLNPDRMIGVIKKQASRLKDPQISEKELIEIIKKSAPVFAQRLLETEADWA